MVARDGTVYKLVDEKNVAWHAGGSIMPAPDNRKNVNRFSIGIEIIATQQERLHRGAVRCDEQAGERHQSRHTSGISSVTMKSAGTRAVGMGLRKDLKQDPGPMFDWSRVRDGSLLPDSQDTKD